MKKRNFGAFSLIEMSIVILVVGIIIAGVTQGSSIILRAKVNSARALTQSSPVASIPGLRLWLETVMEDSFSSTQGVDGASVTTWYDRNTQVSSKLYAITTSSSIVYKQTSTVNSLPSLYFPSGAASDFFSLYLDSSSVAATAIPTASNIFSYFLVLKSEAASTAKNAFYNGTIATTGWGYGHTTTAKTMLFDNNTASNKTAGSALTTAEVISATYTGGTSGTLKLYTNGVQETLSSSTITAVSPTTGFYIGSSDSTGSTSTNWKGYISEVIIFEKKLSDTDRRAVEQYLGKKYNIQVATS